MLGLCSLRFSEVKFKVPVKYTGYKGRTEVPPTLDALTITVHVGDDEEIVAMGTIEVEDIEGCVSHGFISIVTHFGYDRTKHIISALSCVQVLVSSTFSVCLTSWLMNENAIDFRTLVIL